MEGISVDLAIARVSGSTGIFDINAMIYHCLACSYVSESVTTFIYYIEREAVASNSNEYSR